MAFREAVMRARAEAEAQRVAQIARAAPVDWKAAAWALEQESPERWARVTLSEGDAARVAREREDPLMSRRWRGERLHRGSAPPSQRRSKAR